MKRMQIAILAAAVFLCVAGSVSAQLGMNIFKKPNIADIFKPVVGSGATYEERRTNGDRGPTQMEMFVVGTELIDGQPGYWVEVGHQDPQSSQMLYGKLLVTREFQMRKMIFQQPGQPAMEMVMNPSDKSRSHMNEEMEKWHNVGPDTITVPAGTFLCQHWKKDDGVGDAWVSDKVTPMSLVKYVSSNETMALVKTLTGMTDHITGPVTKFDPQKLMQRQKPQ